MVAGVDAAPVPAEDPWPGEPSKARNSVDYTKFASLAALEAHALGLIQCQAMSDKHVSLLKDAVRKEVWLLAKNDDHIVAKGTLLGGYGGGSVMAAGTKTDLVPWQLPLGDKTQIQLFSGAVDDSESKKPKTGTLYVLAKPLEKKASQAGSALTLTSYGKLKPEGQAGSHSFVIELVDGNSKHTKQGYVLKGESSNSKMSSGNIFANLATCQGWMGLLIDMWRLAHDPVRHCLGARKPFVITSEVLHLKKGVPVKVMWLKKTEQQAAGSGSSGGAPAQPGPVPLTS